MIKFYALLSVVSSFAVVGAALMRVIIHFVLKVSGHGRSIVVFVDLLNVLVDSI